MKLFWENKTITEYENETDSKDDIIKPLKKDFIDIAIQTEKENKKDSIQKLTVIDKLMNTDILPIDKIDVSLDAFPLPKCSDCLELCKR